jgi:carbonic anhydrase/acetyltransferase-like protein (isoleucine patch superfamily)
MIVTRNGHAPRIHPSAKIAASAQVVGNVIVGAHSFVNYNVVIESSGPPIHVGDHVVDFANSVVRSVGGVVRPAFPVEVGDHTVIAPLCALTGCRVGRQCYIATGAILLQGATVGDGSRIGVGAIVHVNTSLPSEARVGMRQFAVPGDAGPVITTDLAQARSLVQAEDFFAAAFALPQDAGTLHRDVIEKLLDEVGGWSDEPPPGLTT